MEQPPPPRSGLAGSWDRFVGPGTTAVENATILISAVVVAAVCLWVFRAGQGDDATFWTSLVAVALAIDIAGGVVANATTAAKRWYHRREVGRRHHLGFVAVHGVHIGLVAALFAERAWLYFGVFYALLVVAAVAIVRVPLYVRRPVALALTSLGVTLSLVDLAAAPGLEWFVPLLYVKLLVSHLVPETPFRPGAVWTRTRAAEPESMRRS